MNAISPVCDGSSKLSLSKRNSWARARSFSEAVPVVKSSAEKSVSSKVSRSVKKNELVDFSDPASKS